MRALAQRAERLRRTWLPLSHRRAHRQPLLPPQTARHAGDGAPGGETVTERQRDKGTRRRGENIEIIEFQFLLVSLSPCPLVPLSPCPLVPLSPCPLVPLS